MGHRSVAGALHSLRWHWSAKLVFLLLQPLLQRGGAGPLSDEFALGIGLGLLLCKGGRLALVRLHLIQPSAESLPCALHLHPVQPAQLARCKPRAQLDEREAPQRLAFPFDFKNRSGHARVVAIRTEMLATNSTYRLLLRGKEGGGGDVSSGLAASPAEETNAERSGMLESRSVGSSPP